MSRSLKDLLPFLLSYFTFINVLVVISKVDYSGVTGYGKPLF